MQFPCEIIVRDVLPSFKAFIVKELYHNHKLSQSKIAENLGITQASVSHYLHGERGISGSDLIQKYPQVKEKLLALTEAIATKSATPISLVNEICGLCMTMHDEFGCKKPHR